MQRRDLMKLAMAAPAAGLAAPALVLVLLLPRPPAAGA